MAEVEPYRVGVGLAELADQAKGFRVARARLAEQLRQAGQSDRNMRGLVSLADELREGNGLLADAEHLARELAQSGGDPNNSSLITAVKAFERAAKREDAHAIDLGLTECADRPDR